MNDEILIELGEASEETKGTPGPQDENPGATDLRKP